MKNLLKRILTLALTLCMLIVPFSLSVSAEETDPNAGIMPCLNNTYATSTTMGINDNGVLSVFFDYVGYEGVTTHATIKIKIEKRTLGFFWSDVDQWTTTIYKVNYSGSRNFLLSSEGTYRATVTYTIFGNGGAADVIEYEGSDTYSI